MDKSIVSIRVDLMDKITSFMSLIAYSLIILTYTLGLIEKYNALIGILIVTVVVIIVLIVERYTSKHPDNSSKELNIQEMAVNIKAGRDVKLKGTQEASSSKTQIMGKNIRSGGNVEISEAKQIVGGTSHKKNQ